MIIRGIEITRWINKPTNLLVVDPNGTGVWAKSLKQAGRFTADIFNERGVVADVVNVSYT